MLGDIFSAAQSRFTNPVNLKKLISLIDETEWMAREWPIRTECRSSFSSGWPSEAA